MSERDTFDALQQVAAAYVRSTGEPLCRDKATMLREATAIMIAGKETMERGQRMLFIANMFFNRHKDISAVPSAWDDLVRNYYLEDMEVIHRHFP
jgi:predicted lipid-binding transport protein (Tim44 family)